MLVMSAMIFTFMLLMGVISFGIRMAWGVVKFIFGLGLFWLCPLLFIVVVLFGGFSHLWLPILLIGLLFGRGYRRI
ncbi:MAG: hypothetical protein IIY55_02745 [Blautia sp.]|nr:hypothetical protein [Blautia sp.]